MSEATITGPIYGASTSDPFTEMRLIFELSHWESEEDVGVFSSGPVMVPVDENGNFSVKLFTNVNGENTSHYKLFVEFTKPSFERQRNYLGYFALSGAGTYRLDQLEIVTDQETRSQLDVYSMVKSMLSSSTKNRVLANKSAAIAVSAKDSAILGANGTYGTIAEGEIATVDGYFSIPSTEDDGYIDLYSCTSSVATYVDTYPNSEKIKKPTWSGLVNAWSDPFFRYSKIGTDFDGRKRWFGDMGTNFETIKGSVFSGNAIQTQFNIPALAGPIMYLDEIGASVGDIVTIYALITGDGAIASFAGRQINSDLVDVGGQVVGTSDNGVGVITTSTTPQRIKIAFTVASGATAIRVYPWSNAENTGVVQVQALWGHVGDGPDWPIFEGDPFLPSQIKEISNDVSAHGNSINLSRAQQAYSFNIRDEVSGSSTATLIAATNASHFARDLPFSGFGSNYTLAGISFNSIKIKTVSIPAASVNPWEVLKVIVRTGASPSSPNSKLVAVGETRVLKTSSDLNDVIILLRDPETNLPITLSDADFEDNLYFVGVYSENSDGGIAAMGEPRGNMSNETGVTFFYTGSNDASSGDWSNYNVNPIAFEHLLIDDPVQSPVFLPTSDFKSDLGVSAGNSINVLSYVPPKVYLLEGQETGVYFGNMIADDADKWAWSCDGILEGTHLSERWDFNPSGAIAETLVSIDLLPTHSETVEATYSFNVEGAAASAGTGTTPKVMVIGDSLVNAGVITQTLLDRASADVMGVQLVGQRGAGANLHEGRGGWTVGFYTGVGPTYYEFAVSGVTVEPAINSTVYTDGTNQFVVQEKYLTGGAGTLVCNILSGSAPDASGTLTLVSGAGDASISFTATAATDGNPFWVGGAVDFPAYLTQQSFDDPDWVFIMLGTNDIFNASSDASATSTAQAQLTALDALITSIKATNATIKVGLVPPTPPLGNQDGVGFMFGANRRFWRARRNIILWNKELIAAYGASEADRVYICPASLGLDAVNNIGRVDQAANARTTTLVSRAVDALHPSAEGYRQIGDGIWAFLKNQA